MREANQRFSRCIRDVEGGEEFVITRKGKPVARLIPTGGKRVLTPEQEAALERLASTSWPLGTEQFSREEIYQERVDRYRGK
jgi:antitoxin (DNA-binding transcriptional repressor) of toxin-antitoxin stability system